MEPTNIKPKTFPTEFVQGFRRESIKELQRLQRRNYKHMVTALKHLDLIANKFRKELFELDQRIDRLRRTAQAECKIHKKIR